MSDRAHRRQPATLPEAYQYGDAGQPEISPPFRVGDIIELAYDPMRYQLQDVCISTDGSVHAARLVPIGLNPEWRAPLNELNPQAPSLVLAEDTCPTCGIIIGPEDAPDCSKWRAPHENAAAQLSRNQQRTGDEAV